MILHVITGLRTGGAKGVIPGFWMGIVGMKVGGTRRIEIPYHLAYGDKGSRGAVPPYANLIFTVELLDVK